MACTSSIPGLSAGLQRDVLFAVALCGLLYGDCAVKTTSRELVGEDDSKWRLFRYDVELYN